MYWILLVMGAVVSVVVAVIVGGLMVPASYTVQRRVRLRADARAVHEALRHAPSWPVWLSLARTGLVEPAGGRSPDGVLVAVMDDAGAGVAEIRFRVTPAVNDAGATDVVAREAGHESNPVKRLRRQYLSTGPVMAEALLHALAEAVGDPDADVRGD